MNYLQLHGQEPQRITDAQLNLINFIINPEEAKDRAKDLNNVFELALFSSEQPIDRNGKDGLHSLKTISDYLLEISHE